MNNVSKTKHRSPEAIARKTAQFLVSEYDLCSKQGLAMLSPNVPEDYAPFTLRVRLAGALVAAPNPWEVDPVVLEEAIHRFSLSDGLSKMTAIRVLGLGFLMAGYLKHSEHLSLTRCISHSERHGPMLSHTLTLVGVGTSEESDLFTSVTASLTLRHVNQG